MLEADRGMEVKSLESCFLEHPSMTITKPEKIIRKGKR